MSTDEGLTRSNSHRSRNCLFCEWFSPDGWRRFVSREGCRLIEPNPDNENLPNPPDYLVLLDRSPKFVGHTLVIWRYPFDDICDADEATFAKISEVLSRYSRRIKERLLAEKVYVYSMCDHFEKWELRTENQPTTEHLHFHLLPRFPGAPKGEELFCVPVKRTGLDWEVTPISMKETAKLLRT